MSLASCGTSVFLPLPEATEKRANLVYTPRGWPQELAAEVYSQKSGGNAPAVLLVHGGSWKADGHRWTMTPIARALAREGFVVVNVSYRGTPEYKYPAPLEDIRQALRWMNENSAELGIDPDRVATFGFSAGAHLATLVALEKEGPFPIGAVVAGGGPFDLTLYPDDQAVSAFLGGSYQDLPKLYREASPVARVTAKSPPLFIFHGVRDTVVSPEHARRMAAAYHARGRPYELLWLEGRGHVGTLLFPGNAINEAIEFLNRNLGSPNSIRQSRP